MTIKERIKQIPEGQWLVINFSRFEHMMTGTSGIAVKPSGTICLQYEDGTEESRQGDEDILGMDLAEPSIFGLVGYVQDGRNVSCPS